jgi:hypothetical protein
MHGLHDFVEDLPLVGLGDAVLLAQFAKRLGLVYQHSRSINDKDYCLVN